MCRKSNAFKTQANFADVGELYRVCRLIMSQGRRQCSFQMLSKEAVRFVVSGTESTTS